jgi:hypothetical protein
MKIYFITTPLHHGCDVSGVRKCCLAKHLMFALWCFVLFVIVSDVCAEYEAVQWQCLATCVMIVANTNTNLEVCKVNKQKGEYF